MKLFTYLSQAVQLVLMLSSVTIGALYAAGQFGLIAPLAAYIILSGSMEPSVPVGSIAVVQAKPRYSAGDVITYSREGKSKMTVTHRIKEVKDTGIYYGEPVYITKGDANEDPDSGEVKHANVAGRTVATLPYLGYVADFAKTPRGFMFLIVIPATIIIYEELKNIKRQFTQLLRRIADGLEARKLEQPANGSVPQANVSPFPKIAVLIPAIALPLVFFGTAHAIYADTETSHSNTFVAASEYQHTITPTPTPTLTPTTTGTPTPTPSLVIEITENGQGSINSIEISSSESAHIEQITSVDVDITVETTSDTGRDAIKNNIGF